MMGVIMSRPESREQLISTARLFSIGHSNHTTDAFLCLLQEAHVSAVADVRSRPFSARFPQFNRPELESALRDHDIDYVFLGDVLGGRPEKRSLYTPDGRVDYERVRATLPFRRGVDHLLEGCATYRVAMLCAEEDPLDCHRGLMIAPALAERGRVIVHLRGDGTVETDAELERRLLAETGVGAGILDGLFASTVSDTERKELMAEAYREMARRKAFRIRLDGGDDEA